MRSPSAHLAVAIITGIAALAGYGTWYAVISSKSSAVASLQSQITAATETVSRASSVRTALAEVAGDETVVRGYFVSEAAVVSFINDLEARGTAQGATVSVLSVSTGGSAAQPVLLLALSITGTFDAVMRTVGVVEYAPYAISITTLSVEQSDKNSWQANLNLLVNSVPASTATTTP